MARVASELSWRIRGAYTHAVFYFGEDGLLRRHLYTVDVVGGAQGANYASEYRAVDGVRLATRRRVVAYNEARQKVPSQYWYPLI